MWECNVYMASASSSSEPEPALYHRAADAQLDEELAPLHQELGMDAEPRDRRPAQDIPVQEEPHEGNDDRHERLAAADRPHGRAPTPPARDNNRHANEGVNIDANTDADAPPLFRWASQNLATVDMLLRGCSEAATSEE
jgi:hypothetical protein